jgi:hypothetical protein
VQQHRLHLVVAVVVLEQEILLLYPLHCLELRKMELLVLVGRVELP